MDYNVIKHEIFGIIYKNKIISNELDSWRETRSYEKKEDEIISEVIKTTEEIIKVLNDVFKER